MSSPNPRRSRRRNLPTNKSNSNVNQSNDAMDLVDLTESAAEQDEVESNLFKDSDSDSDCDDNNTNDNDDDDGDDDGEADNDDEFEVQILSAHASSPLHEQKSLDDEEEQDPPPPAEHVTTPMIPARLPGYLADAFGELYQQDGLLVLGRGMGLLPLLASFIRFVADVKHGHVATALEEEDDGEEGNMKEANQNQQKEKDKLLNLEHRPPPLVFVIGLRGEVEWNAVLSTLQNWGTPANLLPTLVTNESGQGKERAAMYRRGGVFIITSRILIVDLLTNVANPNDIEGIFVAHAESVTEQSTEAFILRIYKTQRSHFQHQANMAAAALQANGGETAAARPTLTPCAGFIKAFTDDPAALMAGFAKVDKILKALQVRRLYLYPRFHTTVAAELEKCQPCVEELHQELSPLMKDIQSAIAAAVQTCIREIKNSTTLIEWTHHELTVENCVTKNFDLAISRQLDQDWHRLKPQTKQLVNDLRTLRSLFQYLIQYDCVNFYKLIQNLKSMSAASRYPSMWLLTPAADMVFRRAKERLYRIVMPSKSTKSRRKSRGSKQQQEEVPVLKPVLEQNPKWNLLFKLLSEVKADWHKKKEEQKHDKKRQSSRPPDPRLSFEGGARVLIMVKDERTLETVRSYLVDGGERAMTFRWLRYLEQQNEVSRNFLRGAAAAARGDRGENGPVQAATGISEEARLLLEEEGRARNFLFGRHKNTEAYKSTNRRSQRSVAAPSNKAVSSPLSEKGRKSPTASPQRKRQRQADAVPDWMKKKRRIATERNRNHPTLMLDDIERRAVLDEAVLVMEKELEEKEPQDDNSNVDQNEETGGAEDCQENKRSRRREVRKDGAMSSSSESSVPFSSSEDEDDIPFKVKQLDDLRVVLRTYGSVDGERSLLLLNDLRPSYVILYDADPAFIRSIEIHACTLAPDDDEEEESLSNKGHKTPLSKRNLAINQQQLRVYFMLFEASSEEKNFLKALEREQNAFERLIQHKKSMPLPVNTLDGLTQEMQVAQGAAGSYAGGSLPLGFDTRTGKGKKKIGQERRDIAVDVREFRSALPSILHRGGMRLAPVTLTVGDFVLSPVHCVERKSISDLFGSFASGRLYTQAESMCKHYKCPCLLIEFDPAKSFCLQSANELGGDIRSDSVCSKLCLLAMHFPKLRLLWSREPHETMKIFKVLKMNHEEVDVERAIEIGSNESLDEVLGINERAVDSNPSEKSGAAEEENEINEAARDMLLRLPGININNARKIMGACDSIADLADMSREDIKKLLGPITGQKLFTFFRQKLAAS